MADFNAPANAPETITITSQPASPTKRPREDAAAIRKRVTAENRPQEPSLQGKVCLCLLLIHACFIAGMAHASNAFPGAPSIGAPKLCTRDTRKCNAHNEFLHFAAHFAHNTLPPLYPSPRIQPVGVSVRLCIFGAHAIETSE